MKEPSIDLPGEEDDISMTPCLERLFGVQFVSLTISSSGEVGGEESELDLGDHCPSNGEHVYTDDEGPFAAASSGMSSFRPASETRSTRF